MADTQGQADIRGIEVQKFLTGFADEDTVLKGYCRQSSTRAREIRWYQKTAGFVSPTTTSGITSNFASNTTSRAIAPVANVSVTRNTSYVKKFYMKSELISIEDETDTDVDILAVTLRDLLKGIGSQVDTRIYNVGTESLSPSTINTVAATTGSWDGTGNPILDILKAKQLIRSYRYDPNKGGVLYINSIEEKNLLNYLIVQKGSNIPGLASDTVEGRRLMEILNLKVEVSENATTDYAYVFIDQVTLAWKQFTPLSSEVERIPGVGKIVHAWEEGEALLENPRSCCLITNTVA